MPGKQIDHQAKDHAGINTQNVLFIRHGESEAHIGKAATHIEEVGLTEMGKQKAWEISRMLPSPPDLIMVSPYLRAWETAYPTIQHFADTPHETRPEVREFTYLGSLAGRCLTKQERSKDVNAFWNRWDPQYTDGNGESFSQFIGRTKQFLDELRQMNGLIVVFTHEQFIRAVQFLLLEWAAEDTEIQTGHMQRFREILLNDPLPYGYIDDNSWQQCRYQAEPVISNVLINEVLNEQDKASLVDATSRDFSRVGTRLKTGLR